MKKISFLIVLSIPISGCDHSSPVPIEKISSCDQDKYALIWNINVGDPTWKIKYLEYVGNCLEDTSLAKKLADLDAENGNYNIILHGIETPLCPFQHIHDQHPISFHVPIRVQSEVAEFYNDYEKKLIKQDLKIDLDSLIDKEFRKCFPDEE